MTYGEWGEAVPDVIRQDVLWTVTAYRLALFLNDIAWQDVQRLVKEVCTRSLADQLYRSTGSICANIEEGYSKISAKDRARFYEYSLGSARESRGWFYRARHVLGEKVATHRMNLLTDIIRLLLTMIPDQRGDVVREDGVVYGLETSRDEDIPGYGLLVTDYVTQTTE
jgi:four helix bundle protein